MPNRNFRQLLEAKWDEDKFVCIGLDSAVTKLPRATAANTAAIPDQVIFNQGIIDATKDLVLAYKPNWAFYLAQGSKGIESLIATINYIHMVAPSVPVIVDAKVADIGNTNEGYVEFIFGILGADAVTVHNYLGAEAMKPFLDCADKGIIVLCRTSNSGADEFQGSKVPYVSHGATWQEPLYQRVAFNVARSWNGNNNCALVVGATYPEELREVRAIVGDLPILIPGVGAQGGDLETAVKMGVDAHGRGMIINNSRGIIFASNGPDFAEVARAKTQEMHEQIVAARATV